MATPWPASVLQRIADFLPSPRHRTVFGRVSRSWSAALESHGKKRKLHEIQPPTEELDPCYAERFSALQARHRDLLPRRNELRKQVSLLMPRILQQAQLLRDPTAISLEA
eukprot:EG_transcript_60329